MDAPLRTPLYSFHLVHGAKMVPFAGWEMPLQYVGILEEHRVVREHAGLFDVSHMGEAWVRGSQALAFLNQYLTADFENLPVGHAKYSLMCADDGGVIDDLIVYRVKPDEFLLCLNAANTRRDVEWLQSGVSRYNCTLEDASAKFAQLALQGPKSLEILQLICDWDVSSLKSFDVQFKSIGDCKQTLISRTGYTGEDGFEIYLDPQCAIALAELLIKAGGPLGLGLAGLGARDSLRLEAGYPLYGHELSREITPVQARLGWAVGWNKASFNGREALIAQREQGVKRSVVYFLIEDRRIARTDMEVITIDGDRVGRILSGAFSPTLGCCIGSALIDSETLKYGAKLFVMIRESRVVLPINSR